MVLATSRYLSGLLVELLGVRLEAQFSKIGLGGAIQLRGVRAAVYAKIALEQGGLGLSRSRRVGKEVVTFQKATLSALQVVIEYRKELCGGGNVLVLESFGDSRCFSKKC